MNKQVAKIEYINGWCLILPKYGNAPMLFMEWIAANMPAQKNWIAHIGNDTNVDTFFIRLNITKKEMQPAVRYINDNL